jgi:hypothetical protein
MFEVRTAIRVIRNNGGDPWLKTELILYVEIFLSNPTQANRSGNLYPLCTHSSPQRLQKMLFGRKFERQKQIRPSYHLTLQGTLNRARPTDTIAAA